MPLLNVGFANFKDFKRDADNLALDLNLPVADSLSEILRRVRSGGLAYYPNLPSFAKASKWVDQFNRDILNVGLDYWNIASNGAGNSNNVIADVTKSFFRHGWELVLATTLDNNMSIKSRYYHTIGYDGVTKLKLTLRVRIQTITNLELYLGLLDETAGSATLPSTLPTIRKHIGFNLNTAVSANWRRTSADGTTQNVTTSNIALDEDENDYTIEWSDGNVDYFINGTSIGSNVANLPNAFTKIEGMLIIGFIKTKDAVRKELWIDKCSTEYL